MNSLSKKCQEAKERYDQCFNNWFSERYLKGFFKLFF
jgi:TRIAP1/MDM35 family protein